jgi:hypothetical protein
MADPKLKEAPCMSAPVKKAALVLSLFLAVGVLSAAPALSQVGPGNPSGGTSLRQTTEEGPGSFGPVGFLSRNLTFTGGWQRWFASFAPSRQAVSIASRPSDIRSLLAVARRPSGRR